MRLTSDRSVQRTAHSYAVHRDLQPPHARRTIYARVEQIPSALMGFPCRRLLGGSKRLRISERSARYGRRLGRLHSIAWRSVIDAIVPRMSIIRLSQSAPKGEVWRAYAL